MPAASTLTIYTDGGSRGNPGPSGIGVVLYRGNKRVGEHKEFIGKATNNVAEYSAVLLALQEAKKLGAQELDIYMDSELAVNQLNRKFKIKDPTLGTLFVKAWNKMVGFNRVTFHHIPREENREADRLVNQAIDQHT